MKLTDLTEICEWTHGCAFKPGQAIFLEGDHAHTVYQVVRGVAKLVCVGSSGREIIVGLAGPGGAVSGPAGPVGPCAPAVPCAPWAPWQT